MFFRLSVTQSGSLKIDNLEWSDAGVYQCFASNTAGETKISTWIKVDRKFEDVANIQYFIIC